MTLARNVIEKVESEKVYPDPIVTTVENYSNFYIAEEYHQDYYKLNGNQPYCKIVIDPKVKKFLEQFKDYVKS